VLIRAYNEAGEVVKILYDGAAQVLPGSLQLNKKLLAAGEDELSIAFPGMLNNGGGALIWKGGNDNGQIVNGGVYYIKAEVTDQWGKITSMIESVNVVNVQPTNYLYVFNEAGERVFTRSLSVFGNPLVINISLQSDIISPVFDPVTGVDPASALSIAFQRQDGSPGMTYWQGLNDNGIPVQSGTYTVQLVHRNAGEDTVVQSFAVQVIANGSSLVRKGAIIAPSPGGTASPSLSPVVWLIYPYDAGVTAFATVYNMAGERVMELADTDADGRIPLEVSGLSSGIYVAVFEKRLVGSMLSREIIKFAVVN
jgi:hypothetical protein